MDFLRCGMDNETIRYYDENTELFLTSTIDADMSATRTEFLSYVPIGGRILDAGCGSGRDSLFFIKSGYTVVPMDASKKMCEAASNLIGIQAVNESFEDISDSEIYDGIWACASLLHISGENQRGLWRKLIDALKPEGVLYASYKDGAFQGFRNGRFYCDMTLGLLKDFLDRFRDVQILKLWKTKDVRPEVETEWVNVIVKKV